MKFKYIFIALFGALFLSFSNASYTQFTDLDFDYNSNLISQDKKNDVFDRIIYMIKNYRFDYYKYDLEIDRLLEIKDGYKAYLTDDYQGYIKTKANNEINLARYIIMNILIVMEQVYDFENAAGDEDVFDMIDIDEDDFGTYDEGYVDGVEKGAKAFESGDGNCYLDPDCSLSDPDKSDEYNQGLKDGYNDVYDYLSDPESSDDDGLIGDDEEKADVSEDDQGGTYDEGYAEGLTKGAEDYNDGEDNCYLDPDCSLYDPDKSDEYNQGLKDGYNDGYSYMAGYDDGLNAAQTGDDSDPNSGELSDSYYDGYSDGQHDGTDSSDGDGSDSDASDDDGVDGSDGDYGDDSITNFTGNCDYNNLVCEIEIPGGEWHYVYIKNEIDSVDQPSVVDILNWDNQSQNFISGYEGSSNIYRIRNNSENGMTVQLNLSETVKESSYSNERNFRGFGDGVELNYDNVCSNFVDVTVRELNRDYSGGVEGDDIENQIPGYTAKEDEAYWIYCE